MATSKKITKVGGDESSVPVSAPKATFVPTAEAKGRATRLRTIACILWVLALCAEVGAIVLLFRKPVPMVWIIVLIAVDLALAIIAALCWKKSNRFDPPSKQDTFKFFMQSQLGLVTAVIAFLPLVIFIFTNKNLDGKQKGILGGIAAAALIVAAVVGIDFNPPSVEEYTQQIDRIEQLTGANHVFWTKSGRKYHIYSDCPSINTDRTDEIFEGTVAQAREDKNITELCKICEHRAEKALEADGGTLEDAIPTPSE